jgi:alkanesulfonate monooxygenase SsuD/methylene tetrahydromethanopterin reductase-like flavin-dependent oxidoreductase (luciferase family)
VSLSVGVLVVQNLPWPLWRERVQEVEALGYDGVYVWDHLVHRTQEPTDPLFDGLTVLAAAAEFTSRLRPGRWWRRRRSATRCCSPSRR